MKSADNVGITFATHVVGSGSMNGVVNITLAALMFTPAIKDDVQLIDPDPVITARLRLDESCARQMQETLVNLLADIDAKRAAAKNGAALVPEVSPQPGDKPN